MEHSLKDVVKRDHKSLQGKIQAGKNSDERPFSKILAFSWGSGGERDGASTSATPKTLIQPVILHETGWYGLEGIKVSWGFCKSDKRILMKSKTSHMRGEGRGWTE